MLLQSDENHPRKLLVNRSCLYVVSKYYQKSAGGGGLTIGLPMGVTRIFGAGALYFLPQKLMTF